MRARPVESTLPELGVRMPALPGPEGEARVARPSPDTDILSVALLDRRLRVAVERASANVRVQGEVTSLRAQEGGHAYFVLRDPEEDASIDCVLYRSGSLASRRVLQDGARVVLRGRATVYEPRGKLQFVVEAAELAGRGAILEALERLKEKLLAEGLFAAERKRPLPGDPRVIGVVTSATGAVLHDIARVAFRRGGARILLCDAPVQGPTAAARISRAVVMLSKVRGVDAIVIARGGGSADDLAAYNDERLVRMLAKCPVPIVSAVGHETDVCLADLVADRRAATPSQAAELLVPDEAARRSELAQLRRRLDQSVAPAIATRRQRSDAALVALERAASQTLSRRRDELGRVGATLKALHPQAQVRARRALVSEASAKLVSRARSSLACQRDALRDLERRLAAQSPRGRIDVSAADLQALRARLDQAGAARPAAAFLELGALAARLDALSPLAVLRRGYAIAQRMDAGDRPGAAITSASSVAPGERIRVRVHAGALVAEVKRVDPEEPPCT